MSFDLLGWCDSISAINHSTQNRHIQKTRKLTNPHVEKFATFEYCGFWVLRFLSIAETEYGPPDSALKTFRIRNKRFSAPRSNNEINTNKKEKKKHQDSQPLSQSKTSNMFFFKYKHLWEYLIEILNEKHPNLLIDGLVVVQRGRGRDGAVHRLPVPAQG